MNCRSLLTVACLVVSSFAARSALGYVDESLDPSIGWVVTNETTRVAEERLTPAQEASGVKPWQIALGGSWNSCTIKTGSVPGDNTTLDLSKKFWRKSTKSVLSMASSVAGKSFQDMKTIKKLILPEDVAQLPFNSTGSQFSGCTGLEEVTPFLAAGFTSIPGHFFDGCTSLKGDVDLPNCQNAGAFTFIQTQITSLTIGENVTNVIEIGKQAFNGCVNLTDVSILGTNGWKTTSSSGAGENFKNCTTLKNFTMMSFPTTMQVSAFPVQTAKATYAANKYKVCFFIPKDIVDGQDLLTNGITPWSELGDDVKAAFKARWADKGVKKALGVINDTQTSGASYHYGIYTLPANQFIAYIPDPKLGMKVLFK